MKYPHLIILYGRFQENHNKKQQMMINGDCTCGYLPYAGKFGEIIYLAPQSVRLPYQKSITNKEDLELYLKTKPNSIIWSVKFDQEKDKVLRKLNHRKVYYSCCARNRINMDCDISLVDTEERIERNARLWVKGKDPNYWLPLPKEEKEYDFLLIGKRNDKNESFIINKLARSGKKYNILWIGGEPYEKDLLRGNNNVVVTPFLSMEKVKTLIPKAKIGILLTEHPQEGFPQTLLEMLMCDLPVIYLENAPFNIFYSNIDNGVFMIKNKNDILDACEDVIYAYHLEYNKLVSRENAIKRFSLEKSYKSILEGF